MFSVLLPSFAGEGGALHKAIADDGKYAHPPHNLTRKTGNVLSIGTLSIASIRIFSSLLISTIRTAG